ncbi:MAG: sensor histidine kinase [Cyclobacteriaceae bacterium]
MKLNYRRYLITAVLLLFVGFTLTYLVCESCSKSLGWFLKIGSFQSSLWIFLWIGNDIIGSAVGDRLPWIRHPLKSFFAGMAATVVYSVVVSLLIVLFFEFVIGVSVIRDLPSFLLVSLLITLVVSLFMHGRAFLFGWRDSELNAEKLQRENIVAKYDNLKSQVNPHFLFNSLNVLTSLVYEDKDQAAKFIKQLSEVYRYVLDTREREIVTLEEELNFLHSYLYLQRMRFGEKLQVKIDLNGVKTFVAPMVLQMLAENAIKHNVISEERPLKIEMFAKDNQLVVSNKLQFKKTLPDESPGLGLENIKNRYKFLSNNGIVVQKDSEHFVVKIPFLTEG